MSLSTKLRNLGILVRKLSSALYITGDKAQTNFAAVTPHLDFENRITAKDDLLQNIEARRLPIDLNKIEKRWLFYNTLNKHKIVLEATKVEVQNLLKELKKDPENNKNEIEKILLQLQLVSGDLKNFKHHLYGVEENAALGVLSLPNVLHKWTPIDSEVILHEFQSQPQPIDDCHMTLGISQKLLECADGLSCFLKSDAAIFEFALTNYFQNVFTDLGFIHTSNADFARSNIVEGCGTYYLDNTQVFIIDATSNTDLNKLHLVGGASLYSYMTYFAKHLIQPSLLPLKLFTTGRSYTPISSDVTTLFNLGQSTVGRTFIALEDDEAKMNEILQSLIDNTLSLYKPLNYHFRVVYQPAYKLQNSESLRVSIQMFSNYLQEYKEVGHLSVYDTYLSKRVLFCSIGDENSFVRVISGEVLNVPKMLGCILENNASTNAPLLSPMLRNYVY